MKSEFHIIIDINLHWILAKFLADRPNFFAQGSAKHHNLLFVRSHSENFMDITAHVKRFKYTVTLVKYKVFDVIELQSFFTCKTKDTTWGSNCNVRAVILEDITICLDTDTTVEYSSLDFR